MAEFDVAVTQQCEARYRPIVRKVPRPVGVKTLVIYCDEYGQTWWPNWGPNSLEKGVGGSEEAAIFMAREMAALGYWVEVYTVSEG